MIDLRHRYWVFHVHHHTPRGGLRDVVATFEGHPDAIAKARSLDQQFESVEVFDSLNRRYLPEFEPLKPGSPPPR